MCSNMSNSYVFEITEQLFFGSPCMNAAYKFLLKLGSLKCNFSNPVFFPEKI